MRAYIRGTAHERDSCPRSPPAKSHSACPRLADISPPGERALSPPSPREAAVSSCLRSLLPGSAPAARDQREDSGTQRETVPESAQTGPQSLAPPPPHHSQTPQNAGYVPQSIPDSDRSHPKGRRTETVPLPPPASTRPVILSS